ncbi:TM140 protein, partial [Upupa epops]|nr:TM140 protein [Upupa epops]
TAGFAMVSHEHTATRLGVLQHRCTGYLLWALLLLKALGVVVLMFYALLWEAGNLVNLSDKQIGFYNFCLQNETVSKLQCPDNTHLQLMGIS